jgi:hypothetical protein
VIRRSPEARHLFPAGASPGDAAALPDEHRDDIRAVLPTISVPTLSYRTGDWTRTSRRRWSRARSRAPRSSSCLATTTCRGWAIRTAFSTRSSGSSPVAWRRPSRIVCSPPSS